MTTSAFGETQPGVFPAIQRETWADARTQPFWDAARGDRLVVPRCAACGTFRLPPLPICYVCRSWDMQWTEVPGTGTVYSYTVVRHPLHPALAAVVPYVSAIVELDGTQGEGARMLVNVIGCPPEAVTIGTPVRIVFDHINEEMSVPRAVPAG
jgi:uncharacterized OB-fold protein